MNLSKALRLFWGRAETESNRLALLKEFAAVHVGTCKSYVNLRAAKHPRPSAWCWVCNSPSRCGHHIIQLQHGGRNKPRNVVALCYHCHGLIHPWLDQKKEEIEPLNGSRDDIATLRAFIQDNFGR